MSVGSLSGTQALPTLQERLSPDHRQMLGKLGGEPSESTDDSLDEEVDEDSEVVEQDGHSIIGVSIGRTQDHFKAPQTPAIEKAAALDEEDPFDLALSDLQNGENSYRFQSEQQIPHHSTHAQGIPPAIAERIGRTSKPLDSLDGAVSAYRVPAGQPPTSSGSVVEGTGDNQRKIMSFNLPSLPKFPGSHRFSMPSIDGALAWMRGTVSDPPKDTKQPTAVRDRRYTVSDTPLSPPGQFVKSQRRLSFDSTSQISIRRDPDRSLQPPYPLNGLRRSNSEGSLTPFSVTSRASSLGDDSRWEDIHGQVNSRFKAIKDTLADTNIRLPRFRSPWADNPKNGQTEAKSRGQSGFANVPRGISEQASEPAFPSTREALTSHSLSPTGGMTKAAAAEHPEFTKALKRLTGDVMILGGYRGSVLRSAEPPHRQLWIPVKVGLNLRKVNLEVGLEHEDEERMEETIFASGMLRHIGIVDVSRRLFKRLRASGNAMNGHLRVWDYGYDWRLSPHMLSRRLEEYLERLPCNQDSTPPEQRGATVIAHSLGGLITRHVLNRRPDLISSVVYAGVPQTCVNILGPLRNGDEVLLSSKVLTAQVNFTIRTSFVLLPLDGDCFIDDETREKYHIDFFDPKTWEEYRLSPCIARPLPPSTRGAEAPGLVGNLVGSMANALPSVSIRKSSMAKRLSRSGSPANGRVPPDRDETAQHMSDHDHNHNHLKPDGPITTQMDALPNPQQLGQSEESSVSTAVTLSKDDAMRYLTRTLAEVKQFKQELAHNEHMAELYPPTTVIYGKSVPTVCGARVRGRDGIRQADAYDNLQFASGDGVVLARAAQIPVGYRVVPGGVVSSDRGHISLLGDLEAVGRCLNAIWAEKRRRGVRRERDEEKRWRERDD